MNNFVFKIPVAKRGSSHLVRSNSELRRLLVATGNRSILVVEDIDCSVEFHDRADVAAARALAREMNRRQGYQEDQKGLR
ncbi:ATPase, AAA-type, core [Artemisia annua]|uniref:ATPase, AAA-type, core n=1 Tax=Artemisia annua TaxID=35608 RepID=A0A2U1L3B9_ARTAN|nr:ATPase, AAA-type, core [Artemisia annua]